MGMEPVTGMIQIESGGKCAREEEFAICRWALPREEERLDPGVADAGPREEENGAVHIDQANMIFDRLVSNGPGVI